MSTPSDNPIQKVDEDVIGRGPLARSFAEQVLRLDVSEGVVVGVLGPWGSGKTSFVNLARSHLEAKGIEILDFNPWMFSGPQQLIEWFFVELSTQMKLRKSIAEVGEELGRYGEAFSGLGWLPVVGSWIERVRLIITFLSKTRSRKKEGICALRDKVKMALINLDKPIVVVLDDIDRLTTPEIRDIFKLVRLTASFPNIIYIVAFDRIRVEKALEEHYNSGRDYLEKILQVGVDLPVVPIDVLDKQVFEAIDIALSEVNNSGPFDENAWPDVFVEVIRPLIRNMRDVRRYAVAVGATVRDLNGQIALTDVLALEAVRVFLPDVFSLIHKSIDGLTTTPAWNNGSRGDSRSKEQIDQLINAAADRADVVRALVRRVFLGGELHIGGTGYGSNFNMNRLKDRRVAHVEILRFYLERVLGEGLLVFSKTEEAWACMGDRGAFNKCLRSIDKQHVQDVISKLEVFEDQFTRDHVVSGTVVLLNLLPELPERARGMFDFDSRLVVSRVVLRLLRSLENQVEIEEAVREILPEIDTLFSKMELNGIVGYRENHGHRLVSESAAQAFEKGWRAEVRRAPADSLAKETKILWVLLLAIREADPEEAALQIPDSPCLNFSILRSARTEVKSQSMGSRAVRRFPRLAWDALVQLYGDENNLRERIESLDALRPDGSEELLQLARKYLGGWRPGDMDEE